MVTISFLADHPTAIPELTKWFRAQWPDYFADKSQHEMEQDFCVDASRVRLPIRLVAFESGVLAGTNVLREHSGETMPKSQPELGGLYVEEAHRERGIATELVRSGMNRALIRDMKPFLPQPT